MKGVLSCFNGLTTTTNHEQAADEPRATCFWGEPPSMPMISRHSHVFIALRDQEEVRMVLVVASGRATKGWWPRQTVPLSILRSSTPALWTLRTQNRDQERQVSVLASDVFEFGFSLLSLVSSVPVSISHGRFISSIAFEVAEAPKPLEGLRQSGTQIEVGTAVSL